MTGKRHLIIFLALLFLTAGISLPAEENSGFGFGFDLGIGAETFGGETWQSLTLSPDLAFGKVGFGLDINLHYTFTGGEDGTEFEIYKGDWIPQEAGLTFFELYLPKIRYVRYGLKGDPLYVKLGSIDDATLGNGFIMGNYANTLFLPQRRIFGLSFDLDGALFNFPLIGLETFVSDLTAFDIIGARLFFRPLTFTEIPLLKNLEVGATTVFDRDPYKFVEEETPGSEEALAAAFGFYFIKPILWEEIFNHAVFGDQTINQKKESF